MNPVFEFNRRHAGFWELSGEPNRLDLYALRDLQTEQDAGAWASADARIGRGVYIGWGARIGQGANIGRGVNIEQGADIGQDADIGQGADIGRGTRIERDARIGRGTRIERDARIGRGARIERDAAPRPHAPRDVFVLHPIGSEDGTLTAYRNRDGGVSVTRGCFCGTLDQFAAAVEEKHGDNEYGREYRAIIALLRVRFAELLGAGA